MHEDEVLHNAQKFNLNFRQYIHQTAFVNSAVDLRMYPQPTKMSTKIRKLRFQNPFGSISYKIDHTPEALIQAYDPALNLRILLLGWRSIHRWSLLPDLIVE